MERGPLLLFTALMIYTPCSMLNITREGCGITKLCLASPDNCDPAANDSCKFASFEFVPPAPPNPSKLNFRLQGDTNFFITVGLTPDSLQNETKFYTCSVIKLILDDGKHTAQYLQVIRNNTDNTTKVGDQNFTSTELEFFGSILKCQFTLSALSSSSTRESNDLDFYVILGNGENDYFSSLNTILTTGLLDLSNPRANIPTAAPTNSTMVSAAAARRPNQIHALLTLSALMLSVMLRG